MTATAKELWDVYKEAVGGKTYDGKPMPEFEDCAPSALKGWEAVAEFASRWDRLDWDDTNERVGRFFIPTHSIRDEPAMVAAIPEYNAVTEYDVDTDRYSVTLERRAP